MPSPRRTFAEAMADPEVRAKIAAGTARTWADPEVRAKRIKARHGAGADPEVRARISAGVKRAYAAGALEHVPLPEMTKQERRLYNKLRQVVGRPEALAEVLRDRADGDG